MSGYDRKISIETEAAKDLLDQLSGEDDSDLVADMLEGETGIIEAVTQALNTIDECDVLAAGLKAKIDQMTRRKSAIDSQQSRLRAAIERAMVTLDQQQFRLPTATLSLKKKQRGLVIEDEAQIPSKFFKDGAPKLDRAALKDALNGNEEVTGARLDNGGVSLTVRRA